jgi:hypothetical protein
MLLIFGAAFSVQASTYVGGTEDCIGCFQPHLDSWENVNFVLNSYNDDNDPNLPSPIAMPYIEVAQDGDQLSGTINLLPGYEYISLKWDSVFGLWNVKGESTFDFGELSNGLSHHRLWNPSAVPIPGSIFMLSTGLFGLVTLRRKFRK